MLGVGAAPFLLAHGELLQRAPGALDAGTQLLAREVARGGGVGEAPQLGGLHLETSLHAGGGGVGGHAAVGRTAPARHGQAGDESTHDGQQHEADLLAHGFLLKVGEVELRP